ncbi:MAG: polyisoprenoid-binding protein [Lysobacter sp.]|nr:polyisoprenoid-binding protein [Lysobacter sp.]
MPLAYRCLFAVVTGLSLFNGNAVAAGPVRYNLDPVHTRIMFAIDHAGFSKAIGTVSGSTGSLIVDPEHWHDATLQATVPLARIDLGDAGWNRAALARNLLDAAAYPTAEFVSTRIEPISPDRASVHGRLTMRGVSREIMLDVTLNAAKRHPLPPFRRTIGFSATTILSRKAFGIDAWPSVIGDMVELRIEAEATRSRADGELDATDAPDDDSTSTDTLSTDTLSTEVAPKTTTEPSP